MPNERIVGIDLGTTNSLVAYMQGEQHPTLAAPGSQTTAAVLSIIPGEDGSNLVPSLVALAPDGQIIVGNAARKYLIETSDHAVYSVKRLMGRGLEDIQEEL